MSGGVKFIPLNKESLSALDAVQGSNRSFFPGFVPKTEIYSAGRM
jgi:hypothetical protein